MSTASGFMISLGQCLSTMALYSAGHPARECVIDASFARLVDLLADIQYADYSIIGDSVVFQGRVIDELRSWDWATRARATRSASLAWASASSAKARACCATAAPK